MDAQYSDVPSGYKVLPSAAPPPSYSDVPEGYKVLGSPTLPTPQSPSAVQTPPSPAAASAAAGPTLAAPVPADLQGPPNNVYRAAPNQETPDERLGKVIPQAAVPALEAVQKYAVTPFNKAAEAGGKAVGEMASGFGAGAEAPAAIATGAPPANAPLTFEAAASRAATEHPIEQGILKGAGEAAGSTAADPRNWPFFLSGSARPMLQRIISGGFRLGLGENAVSSAKQLHDNWDKLSPEERSKLATQAGISTLLAGGADVIQNHLTEGYEPFGKDPAAKAQGTFRSLVYKAGGIVPENATFEEANAAYRSAMANLHPDVNPGAAEDAQILNDAWAKVKDSFKPAQQFADVPKGYKLLPPAPEQKPVVHASNDVEDLRASAERQAPNVGDAVAAATKGVPDAKVEAIRDSKDTDRIEDKAERQGVQPSQITDISGAKVTVPDQEAAKQVLANLHESNPVQKAEGSVTGEPQKNGIRQVQALVDTKAPAGEPVKKAEVILQTPEMHAASEQTHDDYRKAQELRAAGKDAEAEKLEAKIIDQHNAAEQAARERLEADNAVQKPSAASIHERPQGQTGEAGSQRGRVESNQQGQEATPQGAEASQEKGRPAGSAPRTVSGTNDVENLKNKPVEVRDSAGEWKPGTVLADATTSGWSEGKTIRRLRGVYADGSKFDNVDISNVRKPSNGNKSYGVDFDGTLFKEKPDGSIGAPIPERIASLKQRIASGDKVIIESHRAQGRPEEVTKIQDALESVGLPRLEVTGKKNVAPELVDDTKRTVAGVQVDKVATDANTPLPPERRINPTERKRVTEMSPEEMKKELLTSPVTQMPNRRAFDEAAPSNVVGMSDADGLKAFNDKFGYDAGNELLRAKADALKEAGLDAYHEKGDEFLYRGKSEPELKAQLEKARAILKSKEFRVTDANGRTVTLKGVDFSHGTGPDIATAEKRLKAHKSEREASGERARGELRGITEVGPKAAPQGPADKVEPKFKHGSTQAQIIGPAAKALTTLRDRIADSDLAGKGKDVGGNHVTVRYGIKGDESIESIEKYLASLSPFTATLGKTEKFPPSEHSEGAAVIIAPIESPELHKINAEIEKHGDFAESSFPEYKPHATVAYVSPEKAGRYVGMTASQGETFRINSIAITDRQGNQTNVALQGKSESQVKVRPAGSAPIPPKRTESAAEKADREHGPLVIKSVLGGRSETLPASKLKTEEGERKGAELLAQAVYEKLKAGESLGNVTELNSLAEKHFGAARTSGTWSPKDAFDAMEAGVNKYLLDAGKELMEMPAEEGLAQLRELMPRITSQGVRTEEQIKNQQFSTPPTESYLAAKVAGLKPSDVVLEPSAGNGGLAVWPKAIGAEVHVNEIAPRRQDMLKFAGFEKPTAHDGELINALLDPKVKPTVVLMNPPFSASTQKPYEAANRNQYGFNHVDQALQRLEPGGRLVAILGGGQANEPEGGASLTGGSSGKWFDKVAQRYQVRANARIHGKEYQKYGTSFATRIIVIDKPTPEMLPSGAVAAWRNHVVKGNFNTLEEAYNALREVAATRPEVKGGEVTQPESRSAVEPHSGTGVPSVRSTAEGIRSAHGEVPAAVSGSGRSESSPSASRPESGSRELRVPEQDSKSEGRDQGEAPGRAGGSAENDNSKRQVASGGLYLEETEARAKREEEDEKDSAYVTYRPTLKGATHPGSIVETKAMATVPMPPLTYKPDLPESVIGKGPDYKDAKLSAVQLEAVAIAGMQNEIVLPSGARASALIGDGTGVGKGREGAAILWDNWRKGRQRLVWMSKNKDLMQDAIRDLEGLGAKDLAKSIRSLGKIDASTPVDHKGILFTTYSLFRSGDKKGNTRAAQIDKWLRGNDNGDGGYMLMDESHQLKNAVVSQGQEASQVGESVKKFLDNMPALRTVSLSATAATDVMNLGYLDRLGLWGPGTPFPGGFTQFAAEISHGSMSAMEMIARELKSQGKYVSRTLTYKGVKYSEIEHKITEDQKKVYETAAKAWRSIQESIEDTIKNTTGGGARQKALAMSQFYSTQQRFFSLLLSSMKIPTTVAEAEKALAAGKSVAITLINTNEAAQTREKNRVATEGETDEEPDYDFGPGRLLKDMVTEHYPVQQYKDDVNSNGEPIKTAVYVKDADGNDTNVPVLNPEAVKARDALVAKMGKELHMPSNPLDELMEQLGGPSKVAELTGRKQRYDPSSNKLVNRGGNGVSQDKINKNEEASFQSGKKRIAILSSAADTGISLHADKGAANQQQRFVITHQVGWSADKAMQMNGRFNRSNQTSAPEYALLKSDLGGESRFISSIARRMESLEALSKGQTKTNAGTDAMSKVNFETDQGRAATVAFYNQLLRNAEVPGTVGEDGKPMSGMEILDQLGVLKAQAGGGKTVPPKERENITRLLNRLLALEPNMQNAVYDYFYDIFDAVVKDAIEKGTIDTGVKRIPGDSFDVKEFRPLASDPTTGAKTFYYPVEAQERMERMPASKFEEMLNRADKQDKHPVVMRNKNTNKLLLAVEARPIVKASGEAIPAVHVMKPGAGQPEKVAKASLHDWNPVDAASRQRLEEAENAVSYAKRELDYYKQRLEDASTETYKDMFEARVERHKAELATARKERAVAAGEVSDRDYIEGIKGEWQKQFEEAPTHKTKEHHLVGGAVMKYWNAIREASSQRLDVYSTVDEKTGQRVVGIEIPANQIENLIARITGGKSTVTTAQIIPDVLQNATTYDLEGGIKISRGRVGRENVVKFTTSNADIQRNLKDMGVTHEIGIQPIYYLPTNNSKAGTVLDKILKEYPVKTTDKPESLIHGESGSFEPGKLKPSHIREVYNKAVDEFISGKLKVGDKYYDVAKVDPEIANDLHLVDNGPRYFAKKAESNLAKVTKGLNDDQIRLASMMVDSDSRDYLQEHKTDEYKQAMQDPAVMAAVSNFEPLQKELTNDRLAMGWPVRRHISVEEQPDGFHIVDRDGAEINDADGSPVKFKTEAAAQKYVMKEGVPEPHLKRTYPEHSKSPLPADTGAGEYSYSGAHEKGLRPPRMDKKSREMSASYHYEHGRKDFSGYIDSFKQTKTAVLKQKLFDDFRNEAKQWTAGTAQPSQIKYNDKTYYRPDIVAKAKQGGEALPAYGIYDPTRGEKFLVINPEQGWAQLSTGKPGIKATDRFLGPKEVVDAMENYDTTRGGEGGRLRRFFQEQIVGLFGPMVHVNNILRRVGQATGTGAFDPRSWPSIARVITSPELRSRVLQGVDDATIDMLSKYGAYTDWSDIGNMNHYIGGNLNPSNWIRAFGKSVLFDPKFSKGWGGLDPKARVVVADYFKDHFPKMSDADIAKAVEDGFGNYNRANWTARQRLLAKFTIFPGWDAASVKWFLRHPFRVGVAGALVVLAINQALKALGKNKGDDGTDLSYIHIGDRKFKSGLVSDSMGDHLMSPVLGALQAKLRKEDIGAGAVEGGMKGSSALAGTLAGPVVEMVADEIYNRKYAGGASQLVEPEDKYTPGTWAPNVELEKRIAFAALKGAPALNRFINQSGHWDWEQGLGGAVMGLTNFKYGAEERLRANLSKAYVYAQTMDQLSERNPEAAAKFVSDPQKATYLMFHDDLSQMGRDLKDIDTQIERVRNSDMPADDRRSALESLKDNRNELLKAADGLNDALSDAKTKQ